MTFTTLEKPIAASAALTAQPTPAQVSSSRTVGQLELSNVTKCFAGSNTPVLEDVSLICKPGEFVAVVGPSGCGKTTLLNLAAGITKPDSGRVLLDGVAIRGPGPDRAMVFQEHGLFPWLTAAQNIEFGLKLQRFSKSERDDRVAEALAMVHLSHSAQKYPHQLSGGMRQRVSIARDRFLNPAVLLMDEPFAALDAQTRELLHQQLQELWLKTRKTVLFVTHSVSEAVRLADRVVVLHAHPGRLRREMDVTLAHPRDPHSNDVAAFARTVRHEIEEEVNRVNALLADEFRAGRPADHLGDAAAELGGGI